MKTKSWLAALVASILLASGPAWSTELRLMLDLPSPGTSGDIRVLNEITQNNGPYPWGPFGPGDPLALIGAYYVDVLQVTPTSATLSIDVSASNNPFTGAYNFFETGANAPSAVMTVTALEDASGTRHVTIAFLASPVGSLLTPIPGGTSVPVVDPYSTLPGADGVRLAEGNIDAFPLWINFRRIPEPATAWLLFVAVTGFGVVARGRGARGVPNARGREFEGIPASVRRNG